MKNNSYIGNITKLEPHQIFVFGSNTCGRHGKGAALQAMKFGAIYGQARGLQGQTYAIVTKDLTKRIHPSISKQEIIDQIKILYEFAQNNLDKEFLVAYKGDNANLNGYSSKEMAELFASFDIPFNIPENIIFEQSFWELMSEHGS